MDDLAMTDLLFDADAADAVLLELGPERPRAGVLLTEQKSRILANWAVRVATQPAFRATPGLRLGDLQRNMAGVLDGAIDAIATSTETVDPALLERALDLAAAHGRARWQEDFGVGDVLTEFHALRHEVWATIWRAAEESGAEDEDAVHNLRALGDRVAETFDTLAIAAAESWAASAMGAA